MLLVSVVVATYSPGAGLDRLVASLDAQTLPASQFEVIFVDDGSPDDTVERLRAIAATRPNVRVERIENSGWASRPRNIGTDLAGGEYVLYMDHDDALYPDALRAAVSFARQNGADVLNGKEARTHDAAWVLDTYRADSAQDLGRGDRHPLVPMNPHKLYRTAFLREHAIRFPEGRRVLWEDIFFNVQVAAHATAISTLSSVPFYHWVQTSGSGSTTFRRADTTWWDHLQRVLESIEQTLGRQTLQGTQLRRHQYSSRILRSFLPDFLKRPAEERAMIEERARALQARFTDADDDAALDRGARILAAALRSGDSALLARAAIEAETDRFGAAVLGQARWVDGRLLVSATTATTARLPGGGTFRLDEHGVFAASAELVDALARAPRSGIEVPSAFDADLSGELAATTAVFTVRGRTTRIAWTMPSSITARSLLPTTDGTEARYEIAAQGAIDVTHALTPALDPQVWDVFLWVNRPGHPQQPRIRSSISARPALIEGRPAVAYTNRDGNLSIDLGGRIASIFDGATPADAVGAVTTSSGVSVTLRLPDVPVSGEGVGSGWVVLAFRRTGLRSEIAGLMRRLAGREHPPTKFPARFRPLSTDGATGEGVFATLDLPAPGRYRWTASARGADMPTWSLHVGTNTAALEVIRD